MDTPRFSLRSDYQPAGDQPAAIAALVDGLESGLSHQTLLGVTGSGKTFTIANVIQRLQRPTLVMAHNKTLAAQLYGEFREFFPENSVEYFVSYYVYYQPEAYVPSTDTYIEKDSSINDEIDRMRLSATRSIFERRDVIIVASVSCIYGLGSPESYYGMLMPLERGQRTSNGYTVVEAADGDAAIARFMEQKDRIQLVVLDVIMPKKTGREVYDAMSAVRPEIKALFISGSSDDIISKKGILEGGVHFPRNLFLPALSWRK